MLKKYELPASAVSDSVFAPSSIVKFSRPARSVAPARSTLTTSSRNWCEVRCEFLNVAVIKKICSLLFGGVVVSFANASFVGVAQPDSSSQENTAASAAIREILMILDLRASSIGPKLDHT